MALSDAEIKVLYADETGFILDDSPAALLDFARAIEADVRKQDDALILQLVEAMEGVKALNMGGGISTMDSRVRSSAVGHHRRPRKVAASDGRKI